MASEKTEAGWDFSVFANELVGVITPISERGRDWIEENLSVKKKDACGGFEINLNDLTEIVGAIVMDGFEIKRNYLTRN